MRAGNSRQPAGFRPHRDRMRIAEGGAARARRPVINTFGSSARATSRAQSRAAPRTCASLSTRRARRRFGAVGRAVAREESATRCRSRSFFRARMNTCSRGVLGDHEQQHASRIIARRSRLRTGTPKIGSADAEAMFAVNAVRCTTRRPAVARHVEQPSPSDGGARERRPRG